MINLWGQQIMEKKQTIAHLPCVITMNKPTDKLDYFTSEVNEQHM